MDELFLQEAKVFKELVVSKTAKGNPQKKKKKTAKGLIHVFFAQRATSKV